MSGCCGGGYEHSPLDDYFVDLVRREEQLAHGVQQHGEGHGRDDGRGGGGLEAGAGSPVEEGEEEEGVLDRAAHEFGRAIRHRAEYMAEAIGLRRHNEADDVLVTLLVVKGGGVVSPEELSAMYASEPDRTEFLMPQFVLVAIAMVRQRKYAVAEGIASFLVAESARSPVFAVRAFLTLRMLATKDTDARFNTSTLLSAPSSPATPGTPGAPFQIPGGEGSSPGNRPGSPSPGNDPGSPGRREGKLSSLEPGDEFIYVTMLAIRDAAMDSARDHLGEAIERATAKHVRNTSFGGTQSDSGGSGSVGDANGLGASLSDVTIDVGGGGDPTPTRSGHARSMSEGLVLKVGTSGRAASFQTPQTPFEAQLLFIEQIMDNCENIQGHGPAERQGVLEVELVKVQSIVDRFHVWPPHLRAADVLKSGTTDVPRIVRVPIKNCRTFNSKARVPFLCYTEVLTKGLGGHYDEHADDYLEPDGPMSKLAKNFAQAAEDMGAFVRGTAPKDRSSMDSPQVAAPVEPSRRRQSAGMQSGSPYTEVSTSPRGAMDVELDTPGRGDPPVLDPRDEDHEYDDEEIRAMETSEGALGMNTMPVAKGMVRHVSLNDDEMLESQSKLRDHFNANRRVESIRGNSPFGNAPGWRLDGVIVKNQDDLRQELLALQLVGEFRHIFLDRKIKCWVRPYDIVPVTATSGFLELVLGCKSVHEIKEDLTELTGESHPSLVDYWKIKFGHPESKEYKTAIRKFLGSCAAYAVITFLLRMKDRHNGNIMIDDQGHLVHIDFGFMLTNTPGGTIGNTIGGFERAPFKLTPEMVMLMGGPNTRNFRKFRELCIRCYLQARRKRAQILALVDIFGDLPLPCFSNGGRKEALEGLTARFAPNLNALQAAQMMSWLIDQALGNYSTKLYDQCQACMQGIRY